jgi:dihydrodipicolinate synthase/N-acetylneuraminate lyase
VARVSPRALAGVLPVVQTPLDNSETIDESSLRRELDWVLDQGADGLTTGMVSEVLRLSDLERSRLGAVVVEAAGARGRVAVLSCGAESTRVAVARAREAQSLGADAVMATPPVTVALPEAALFEYFAAVAEATELTVVVQDASGYVGQPLSIELQARLEGEFPGHLAFKPEAPPIGPRVSALREATGGTARVLEGTGGAMLYDTFARGVVGTMPGAEVCWAVVALWRALVAGDGVTADAIAAPLADLVAIQTTLDSFVAVEKYLLVRQGIIPSARARGPVGFTLDAATTGEVERLAGALAVACDRAWPGV